MAAIGRAERCAVATVEEACIVPRLSNALNSLTQTSQGVYARLDAG
jgi:hypothetical protein